jgi:metal transporter CNNM
MFVILITYFIFIELKELINIMGESKIDLTADEVIIIGGVLEMRGIESFESFAYFLDKTPINIMKSLDEVFMISYDAELDKSLLHIILKKGFSRIPVFKGDRTNILGMIMVKSLLEIDLKDRIFIKNLNLSTIPKFSSDHSLFSIFHEFKQGKSHMAIVESVNNGSREPIGIITLEDLIEELIQQEIIDETDEPVAEARQVPIQAALQGYLLQSIKSNSELSGKNSLCHVLSPKEEGNVSELLLNNKK